MMAGVTRGAGPAKASSDTRGLYSRSSGKHPSASAAAPASEPEVILVDDEEMVVTEVFSTYDAQTISRGKKHPGEVVEPHTLASTPLPDIWYPLFDSLPETLVDSGGLSRLQLEGIAAASQRFQHILHSGERAGFFLGDGAGVGKGRQIAGLILENFARGRRKAVWFSASSDLYVDAQRDLTDVGCHCSVINGCKELDQKTLALGLASSGREGVLFSTYAMLASSGNRSKSNGSRFDQILKWCGDDFDGCIVFDECHRAKNCVPGDEEKGSKIARCVCRLQRALPHARVLYCSATGVTDLSNMAFFERLGLWGEGSVFPNFEDFLKSIAKHGLPALETLAIEMKSSGLYLARGLSYRSTEFQLLTANLTAEQTKLYNDSCALMKDLKVAMAAAIAQSPAASETAMRPFGSVQMRFFQALTCALKIPAVLAEAKAALAEGYAVIFGLQSTGESGLVASLKRGEATRSHGFISTIRESLLTLVHDHYPADAADKELWIRRIQELPLPPNALDQLIHGLGGPSSVAEMTGRKNRVVANSKGHFEVASRYDSQATAENVNILEMKAFQDGEKLAAIISDAASTGISLHADSRAKNCRRRMHFTIELPWSADKAIQQLGRSHRSNQVAGPVYKLVVTELGGERRFASAVSKRLRSLGAITRGDRRAAGGQQDLADFNFDTKYGQEALRSMANSLAAGTLPPGVSEASLYNKLVQVGQEGTPFYDSVKRMQQGGPGRLASVCAFALEDLEARSPLSSGSAKPTVKKFLSSLLTAPVLNQNILFKLFEANLDRVIADAKKALKYNEGVAEISGTSVVCCPTTPPKQLTPLTKHTCIVVDRGLTFEMAMKMYQDVESSEADVSGGSDKDDADQLDDFIVDDEDSNEEDAISAMEEDEVHVDLDKADGHQMTKPGPDTDKKPTDNTKQNPRLGFFRSKKKYAGRHLIILATPAAVKTGVLITRPNLGVNKSPKEITDFKRTYERIELAEAKERWDVEYERSARFCVHADETSPCKFGPTCPVGCRLQKMSIITGMIVAVWTALEELLERNHTHLTKAEQSMRIVRVQLDDGSRLVGLRYPDVLVPQIAKIAMPAPPTGEQPIEIPTHLKWNSDLETTLRARFFTQFYQAFPSRTYLDAYVNSLIEQKKTAMAASISSFVEMKRAERQAAAARAERQRRAFTPLKTEDATPVDPKSLKMATTVPRTLLSFFSRTEGTKSGGSKSSASKSNKNLEPTKKAAPKPKVEARVTPNSNALPATKDTPSMEIDLRPVSDEVTGSREKRKLQGPLAASFAKKAKVENVEKKISGWECASCTYVNLVRPSRCEVCGTMRLG